MSGLRVNIGRWIPGIYRERLTSIARWTWRISSFLASSHNTKRSFSRCFYIERVTYLQGLFSSKESCDRCLTRSRVPVGPLSEKCTPNERFLCGNVPPKLPPMLSDIMLLLSRRSSSSTSLSSKWFGSEPQNLYLWAEEELIIYFRGKRLWKITDTKDRKYW